MYKILIVDDVLENRKLLASIISENTDYEVITAKSGHDIINRFESIENNPPDLILLDILMPKINGFHIAQILKGRDTTKDIPIIFITALTTAENKIKAFEAGGVDYISKPFHKQELLARVNTHLKIKILHDELKLKQKVLLQREVELKELLDKKTKTIKKITKKKGIKEKEEYAAEDRDEAEYVIPRVCNHSANLAEMYGCPKDFIRRIRIHAAFIDAGEAGLPEGLLALKRKFTDDEVEIMRQHVLIGANLLDTQDIDSMAKNIALYHHEKWDGKGYISNLKGESIPLEARITGLVDVYYALISTKPYREAFSEEDALIFIQEESGKAFEPRLVDFFVSLKKPS
ncbi:MAG: response regulator [Spirochaetales bacterium]|nr:response regulator [Spirochaetales bacterium]